MTWDVGAPVTLKDSVGGLHVLTVVQVRPGGSVILANEALTASAIIHANGAVLGRAVDPERLLVEVVDG